MERYLAFLRGINVGGHNKIPMAELRERCESWGFEDVRSYIQSGNLIFRSHMHKNEIEDFLSKEIEAHFGVTVPVIVRRDDEWLRYSDENPFPEAAEREANLVMIGLCKKAPAAEATSRLAERARHGERVVQVGDDIWIHFAGGSGTSRLSPSAIDKAVESPVTTRNWRTVLKLSQMLHDDS